MDQNINEVLINKDEENQNRKEPKAVSYEEFQQRDPGEYTGELDDNGKRSGKGQCVYKNGSKYDGEWKDGKRNGQGVLTEADGDRYEGSWKDDLQNGDGIMRRYGSKEIKGVWNLGRLDGKAVLKYIGSKIGFKQALYVKDLYIKSVKQDKWYDHFFIPFLLMFVVPFFIWRAQTNDEPIYYLGAACFYVLNFIESCQWSYTDKYLKNNRGLEETQGIIEMCKKKGPRITWMIKNYGYEEHFSYDQDQSGSQVEKKKQKKIMTHYAEQDFVYDEFVDQTAPVDSLDYLKTLNLTCMKQNLYIKFSPDARQRYEKQKAEFFAANSNAGEEQVKTEERVLVGMERETLIHNDASGQSTPWYASRVLFRVLTFLMINWIQRIILVVKTTDASLTHKKELL